MYIILNTIYPFQVSTDRKNSYFIRMDRSKSGNRSSDPPKIPVEKDSTNPKITRGGTFGTIINIEKRNIRSFIPWHDLYT